MPKDPITQANYELFRECFAEPVLSRLAAPTERPKKKRARVQKPKGKASKSVNIARCEDDTAEDAIKRRLENGAWAVAQPEKERKRPRSREDIEVPDANSASTDDDGEELSEFIDYLAAGIFDALPPDLRTLSYHTLQSSSSLQETYALPLSSSTSSDILAPVPPNLLETLSTYLPTLDTEVFLTTVLTSYLTTHNTPPPAPSQTKSLASGCEICLRSHIPLTYHHLIPRSVHDKVRKRGWHEEWALNDVAWLCRQCHSFVHRMASNEELAREWYTVERLLDREDVRAWRKWCGGVRWRKT